MTLNTESDQLRRFSRYLGGFLTPTAGAESAEREPGSRGEASLAEGQVRVGRKVAHCARCGGTRFLRAMRDLQERVDARVCATCGAEYEYGVLLAEIARQILHQGNALQERTDAILKMLAPWIFPVAGFRTLAVTRRNASLADVAGGEVSRPRRGPPSA